MPDLVWQDPPNRSGGRSSLMNLAILEALQQRPNQWAIVLTQVDGQSNSSIYGQRTGLVQLALRHGIALESVSRKNTAGKIEVFARVVE